MKICIYGAGAIGGLLGVQLALAGQEVTLIDAAHGRRGPDRASDGDR
jgi:ketopantoate reductase